MMFVLIVSLSAVIWRQHARTEDQAWFKDLVHEGYSKKVRDSILPEAISQANPRFWAGSSSWKFIYSFFEGYLDGLEGTAGTTIIGNGKNAHQQGFDQGLAFFERTVASGAQKLSLEDFGYEPMVLEGSYECDFEASDFRPRGKDEKWWVDFKEGATASYASKHDEDEDSIFDKKRNCRFKGYLAPDEIGGVGHFNQYDRKFLVTEIVEAK